MNLSFLNDTRPQRTAGFSLKPLRLACALLGGCAALSTPGLAGDASKSAAPLETAPAIWEKPAWMTDLSVRVGESYDSNIYLSGAAPEYYPKTIPAGDVATTNKPSWVTTVSPKIGVDFAKLLGSDSVVKLFTVGYAPDIVVFHEASSETYTAHRITTGFKAKADNVTVNLDNAFTYLNGSDDGLIYPAGSSSFVNGTVRERREQWQERLKTSVKVDLGPVFVRPAFSLLYYDLATNFKNVAGYTNYVDRYDANGGVDLGYNVTKNVAFTVGYRYGTQYQQAVPFDLAQINAGNDYQRVLFGVEGSPLGWLKIEAAVGPQFTTYNGNRPYNGGVTADGRIDQNTEDVYAEASVTMALTSADALVFKYKRWNWVSSTGKNAYVDTLYDASYRHQFTPALQWEVGLRAGQADYNPSAYRNDWDYTVSTGFRYAFTKNLSLDVSYAFDKGDNAEDNVTVIGPTREFERSIVSTGVTWKF
ncbi:MAG: outer membrane beta-barrel protein [Chthoniobacteraceae bacterium]|nr:outer membrane beta-barrel protein [Chthoniobacteraceae bacterium]